ncbi:hypothetical protein [Streptomyces sp. NPDC093093]|uniref:hypothetical protein n=1 Tax=Streptomyces sp. NPDC093093 TaxID=3366025 RepID=UPI0037FFF0AD
MALAPNPHSPYATAAPDVRHIIPTLVFGALPTPGTLVAAGCDRLTVVPTEPLTNTAPGDPLPDGLCPDCITAMNGGTLPDPGPARICTDCGLSTRHNGMCALCRMDAHDAWQAQRAAPQD